MADYTWVPRAEWDERGPRRDLVHVGKSLRKASTIHHSTGRAWRNTNGRKWVRSIRDYHMDVRGWDYIGYNEVAWRDPGNGAIYVFEARGVAHLGAHVANANTPNIGLCWLGDYRDGYDDFTDAMWSVTVSRHRAYERYVGHKLAMRGHGQLASTACPGHQVMRHIHAGLPTASKPKTPDWTVQLVRKLPLLRRGDSGKDVRTAQGCLHARGYTDSAIDGAFGPLTERAVMARQRDAGIAVDGIIGQQTWPKLLGL